MRRMTFLVVAAAAVAGCGGSTQWVHPDRGVAERDSDLKACESQADDRFEKAESQALGHGDYDTYGDLSDQRTALMEQCMTERGWIAQKETPGARQSQPPQPAQAAPASQPVPVAPAPERPAAAGAAEPAIAPAAEPPTSATRSVEAPPAGESVTIQSGVAAGTVAPEPPVREAAPQPAPAALPPPPASAPVPQGLPAPAGGRSESQRSADQHFCEAEADSALADRMGAALAHGDLSTYDDLEARKVEMAEKCMRERGWEPNEND